MTHIKIFAIYTVEFGVKVVLAAHLRREPAYHSAGMFSDVLKNRRTIVAPFKMEVVPSVAKYLEAIAEHDEPISRSSMTIPLKFNFTTNMAVLAEDHPPVLNGCSGHLAIAINEKTKRPVAALKILLKSLEG